MDNQGRRLFIPAGKADAFFDQPDPIAFHPGGLDNAAVAQINERRNPCMRRPLPGRRMHA
jgi:hypothetical protein